MRERIACNSFISGVKQLNFPLDAKQSSKKSIKSLHDLESFEFLTVTMQIRRGDSCDVGEHSYNCDMLNILNM